MKKFVKRTVIMGLIFIAAGAAAAIAALGLGAVPGAVVVTDDGIRYVANYEIRQEIKEEIYDWLEDIGHGHWSHRHRMEGESFSAAGSMGSGGEFDGISKLDLELDLANVEITASDGTALSVSLDERAQELGTEVIQDGGRLKIRQDRRKRDWLALTEQETGTVWIAVPGDWLFEELECDVDAGSCRVAGVRAVKMDISASMGSIEVKESSAEELDVSTDAGYISFQGSIGRKADAECDMGTIELNLAGKPEEFNYSIESDMGTIQIGDQSHSGPDVKLKQNHNAAKELNLKTDMGNISVTFEE